MAEQSLSRRDFLGRATGAIAAVAAVGVIVPPAAPHGRASGPLMSGDGAMPAFASPRARSPRAGVTRPVPTPAQIAWQRDELAMFAHFTVNTFTDREWGDGTESPALFAPTAFDARQWARTARKAGFRSIVLTAKHHDGFCLWPSRQTQHSVASSPWREGKGDVVREVAEACRAEGLGLGLYLSPWDRHEPTYGDSPRYMDYYCAQLEELLTSYGQVREVWFDGANGEGPNGRRQVYDWPRIHATVRRLQPEAVMFSDAGPDVRWIGNERGVAGETCWSTIDPAAVPYAGYDAPGVGELLQRGDPHGSVWRPGETDVSIRPGWFWHAAEDSKVRSPEEVLGLYFSSVGRNSKLLLNVPPTRAGVLHAVDVASLEGFARRREALFATDHFRDARVTADSAMRGFAAIRVTDGDPETHWSAEAHRSRAALELTLPRSVRCNTLRLGEPIARGQAVERFELSGETASGWQVLAHGTTVGYCRLAQWPAVTCRRFRLRLHSSIDTIRLATLALYDGER